MELKEYILLIKKRIVVFIIIIILVCVATFGFSASRPQSFITSVTVSITTANRQNTNDFQYDGFYAVQASELFSDNVESWTENPDVVVDTFRKANLALPTQNIRKLSKILKGRKLSPQNVEIRFSSENEEHAKKLVAGLEETLQQKTETINNTSNGSVAFNVVFSEAITKDDSPNVFLNSLIGFALGIIVAFGSIIVLEYFHTPQSRTPSQEK